MKNFLDTVIEHHRDLWGNRPDIEKIKTGFTNTVYSINNTFILKICTNAANEKNFKKEVEFYSANNKNPLVAVMYYQNTDKNIIPYHYEIIEKIEGVSLYYLWHTFEEKQREEIIKRLCDVMAYMHSHTEACYNWNDYNKEKFYPLYDKAKKLNIFNRKEQKIVDKAFLKFDEYLKADKFVLVHNDLHFDNIFNSEKGIKIIDFERSMFAPADFELDIIYRMVRKPWKFAGEETEDFTDTSQYKNIMKYIKKYYPALFETENLSNRLAIYDMLYFLKQLVDNPGEKTLKKDVMHAAKGVMGEIEFLKY